MDQGGGQITKGKKKVSYKKKKYAFGINKCPVGKALREKIWTGNAQVVCEGCAGSSCERSLNVLGRDLWRYCEGSNGEDLFLGTVVETVLAGALSAVACLESLRRIGWESLCRILDRFSISLYTWRGS